MIPFHRITLGDKAEYEAHLAVSGQRGCEYAFANQFLWGRQEIAFCQGCVVFFSHFMGRTLYPYPIGKGDKRAAILAMLEDAFQRGIPCRISGMTESDRQELESLFPGQFQIWPQRSSFDYVYDINALADLKGKKLQKKRNHVNRFRKERPDCRVEPLTACNLPRVRHMVNDWYVSRRKSDPEGDYMLESLAMARAFQNFEMLGMEGLVLLQGDEVLAVTLGSRLSETAFDIHFEKAREEADGAYPTIACEFARFLREKYPEVRCLNREDDMGLEGLRKAKLSWYPDHMVEKYWACLTEDIYED